MSAAKGHLTIDGRSIEAEAGKSLLEVALDHGIEIPHFCYHEGLGIDGNCRLCLVEIRGVPKLQISCNTPVKAGMVVFTNTDAVQKARRGVLEFFLLNHPLDCPFCDKGGECPLQNFTLDAGQFASRLLFEKIHKAKHQLIGDHIILDKERCVLCNRCVRFGRDLAGHEELSIRNRGARCEIFVPEGTMLTTGFTGNYADICPVGALTTREFRFQARPWEMKTTDTICGECSLGCNVQAWRKESHLLRLTPRIAPEVNEWWLCDRGRFVIHEIRKEDRLATFAGKDPESVVSAISEELRRLPERSLAIVAEPTATNEEIFFLKTLAAAAGNSRIFVPVANEVRKLAEEIRKQGFEISFPTSLEESRTIAVLGENLEEDHPVLALRLRRLSLTKGIKIVLIPETDPDPLKSLGRMLGSDGPVSVLLSDRWVSKTTYPGIHEWLDALSAENLVVRISLLVTGANARGMIDQWDDRFTPLSELETEIQRGKVRGLIWFGATPSNLAFDEYAKGMETFVQFAPTMGAAHRAARWVLPLELTPEKNGTFTNTFGRVQKLRKSIRVISKGFAPFDLLRMIAAKLGRPVPSDLARIYSELAHTLPGYPTSISEIPEVTKTYEHYERALWR
ncbi:MAG: 2Fe-2S iron-sulfur cluster-binding protein [Pseudomonadota bacterium]